MCSGAGTEVVIGEVSKLYLTARAPRSPRLDRPSSRRRTRFCTWRQWLLRAVWPHDSGNGEARLEPVAPSIAQSGVEGVYERQTHDCGECNRHSVDPGRFPGRERTGAAWCAAPIDPT